MRVGCVFAQYGLGTLRRQYILPTTLSLVR
jgi:hypothetical protein